VLLAAGWMGYGLSLSWPSAGTAAGYLTGAAGLCLAVLVVRTHLNVSAEGLADHRMFRVVRLPWHQLTGFEVTVPSGAFWDNFCVTAVCRDGEKIGLVSTRVYARAPSAGRLDELNRIRRILEEATTTRVG
jgi:hypothetical protein